MKKAILILVCIGFWGQGLVAQNISKSNSGEYKAKFGGSAKERRLEINLDKSDLTIEGYNGDELIITTDENDSPPERAKGLKSLYANGTDNTGLGLEVITEGSTIKVTKVNKRDGDYKIKVPKNISLTITEMSWHGGDDFKISDIEGDIEVEAKTSNVVIRNLNGSVVAHNTSGDIDVIFSKVNADKPTSITNISGEVDITLPADTKANVKTKSISGDVYTDFDIAVDKKNDDKSKGMKAWVNGGYEAKGTIGGGGVEMRLESISGNVYIRKK
jgi:ribosome-associated translation inhibitor RaiA